MVQVDARGIFLQIDLLWDGVRGRPTRRAPSAVMCNGPKAPMQPYGTCTGTEAQVFGARKQTTRARRDHILSLSSCPFAGLKRIDSRRIRNASSHSGRHNARNAGFRNRRLCGFELRPKTQWESVLASPEWQFARLLGSLPAFEERPGRLHHDPGQREQRHPKVDRVQSSVLLSLAGLASSQCGAFHFRGPAPS